MKIMVVRPQPGADATAARVRAAGFEPVVQPLFAIEPVPWQPPLASPHDAVLLTSGNAVRMGGEPLQAVATVPVYAVGAATARASAEAGLHVLAIGSAGVDDMLRLAHGNGHRHLLWLAGEDRTDMQIPTGMMLDIVTVYRSTAVPAPPGFARAAASADAVLLHSVRAARHFRALCDGHAIDRSRMILGVLSDNIGLVAGDGWDTIIVAPRPDDATLLSAMQRRFTSLPCDPYRNQG